MICRGSIRVTTCMMFMVKLLVLWCSVGYSIAAQEQQVLKVSDEPKRIAIIGTSFLETP